MFRKRIIRKKFYMLPNTFISHCTHNDIASEEKDKDKAQLQVSNWIGNSCYNILSSDDFVALSNVTWEHWSCLSVSNLTWHQRKVFAESRTRSIIHAITRPFLCFLKQCKNNSTKIEIYIVSIENKKYVIRLEKQVKKKR